MAGKLGRDSYSTNVGGGQNPPMAQSTKNNGIAGGSIQSVGQSGFNTYGNAQGIAQQAAYDREAIDSIVGFALKMGEPSLKKKLQEQQLYGMQLQAKGVSLEEFNKTQPKLSKFFGDTAVLEGARVYAVQDEANKRALEIEKNWEEYKKLPPDQFRQLMMEKMTQNPTGDPSADAQIMGAFMDNMPKLMSTHYQENFKYQQAELSKNYMNNLRSSAERINELRRQKGEGIIDEQTFQAELAKIKQNVQTPDPLMTDENRAVALGNAAKYAIMEGIPDLIADIPEEIMSTLPAEVQSAFQYAKRQARDNANKILLNDDVDFQRKMGEFKTTDNVLAARIDALIKEGDYDGARLLKDQRLQNIQASNEYIQNRTGSEVPFISFDDQSDVESSFVGSVILSQTKAKMELLKEQETLVKEREQFLAMSDAHIIGRDHAQRGTYPTAEEINRLALQYNVPQTFIYNQMTSYIDKYKAEVEQYRKNHFDREEYNLWSARKLTEDPLSDNSEDAYINKKVNDRIAEQNDSEKRKIAEGKAELNNIDKETDAKVEVVTVNSYNFENFDNITEVNNYPNMREWARRDIGTRKKISEDAIRRMETLILSGNTEGKSKDEIQKALGYMVFNHTTTDGPRIHSDILKTRFNIDKQVYNEKQFYTQVKLFGYLNENPQIGLVLRETIGNDTYERFEAAYGTLSSNEESDPHKVWNDTIGNKDFGKEDNRFERLNKPQQPKADGTYPWQSHPVVSQLVNKLPENARNPNNPMVRNYMSRVQNYYDEIDQSGSTATTQFKLQSAEAAVARDFDKTSSNKYLYENVVNIDGEPYGDTMASLVKNSSTGLRFDPAISDKVIEHAISVEDIEYAPKIGKDYQFIKSDKVNDKVVLTYRNTAGEEQTVQFGSFTPDLNVGKNGFVKDSVNVFPNVQGGKKVYTISFEYIDGETGQSVRDFRNISEEQYLALYAYHAKKPRGLLGIASDVGGTVMDTVGQFNPLNRLETNIDLLQD